MRCRASTTRSTSSAATSWRTTSPGATCSSPTASGCAARRSTPSCPCRELVPASRGRRDPQALPIRAILNGEVMQDSNTSNQIFGVAEVVSFVSQAITLEPGDLIITGTPAGVGAFRDPPVWLKPGDEITIEIDGLGSITNPVTAGEPTARGEHCAYVLVVHMTWPRGTRIGPRRSSRELARAPGKSRAASSTSRAATRRTRASYLFYEQYRDKAAFDEHAASEHFQRLAAGELFGLMESRERRFWETSEAVEAGAAPRRAVPRGARAPPAARRHRAALPVDPGRPRHLPRGRGPARDDPRAVHGRVRAACGVPVATLRLAARARVRVALIGVFGIARARRRGSSALILLTFPVGVGMGIGNALLPVSVKERFADRPGVRDRRLRRRDRRRRDALRGARQYRSSMRSAPGAGPCSSSPS